MLCYNRIDICEGIDVAEFVAIGFLIIGLNFKILYVMDVMIKSVDYHCIIHGIRKFETILFMKIVVIYKKHVKEINYSRQNMV